MIHDEGTNNKLLLLFILEKLEMPISDELLVQIASVDNDWIPYFFCKQLISDLVKSGFITRASASNGQNLMVLTNDGRTCLSHFYNDIPLSVREDVTKYVKAERLSYRKKQEFLADYFRNNDGTFTVSLRIMEVSRVILDLKFVVANRAVATSIYNSWNDKAPELYTALRDVLIES